MRRLSVFNHVSLDGYFCDAKGDMSWAHRQDPEWREFMSENASAGGALVFGRVTYQLMASYWPTAAAHEANPAAAEGMTRSPKVVFSRTLSDVSWDNTALVHLGQGLDRRGRRDDEEGERPGPGHPGQRQHRLPADSRTLDRRLHARREPHRSRQRSTMFEGVENRLRLALMQTRAFSNGNVVLRYEPVR